MESFLKLYFGNALGRNRVIMTIIYLIAIVLLVTRILHWFGIHYSYPEGITLASVFNFILSAQILYPLAGIVICYAVVEIFITVISDKLYQKYKFYIFRNMSDDNMIGTVETELMTKKYITVLFTFGPKFAKQPPTKGVFFHHFESFLKVMFWDDFNVIHSWKLSTQAMFAVMLAFGFHMQGSLILVTGFVLSVVAWIIFFLVYWQFMRQGEYMQLYEQYYFNLLDPTQAKEIYPVSTWNKHTNGYLAWEGRKKAKKRLKNWQLIRQRKQGSIN